MGEQTTDAIEYEKVTLREARKLLEERNVVQAAEATSWEDKRRPLDAVELELQEETFKWLASLPEKVQPRELGRQYPRIANRLALVWGKVAECERELDGLLIDNRGNRRGFPKKVVAEIMALKLHFMSEHQLETSAERPQGLKRRWR